MTALKYAQDLSINPEDEQTLEPYAINRLAEIHCPTLVIVGALDDPNTVTIGDLLATGIAGARKIVMPTAHIPNMELPDEFNRYVLDFLASLNR